MSAFGGKADMAAASQNVRYWHKADIARCSAQADIIQGKADI